MTNYIHRVVEIDETGCANATDYSETELIEKYKVDGKARDFQIRKELANAPKIKGFAGPMYDGEKNGIPVRRYETWEVNDILSR